MLESWAQAKFCLLSAVVMGAAWGSGCSKEGSPEVGFNCRPDTESIQTDLFAPSCGLNGCHGEIKPSLELDFASAGLGARVINRAANGCGDRLLVVPGDPERSYLIEKLEQAEPTCGDQMPSVGMKLSSAQLACVRAWISELQPMDAGAVDASVDAPTTDARAPADVPADIGSACAAGRISCGVSCVDPTTDVAHCGGCGMVCVAGQVCTGGACQCAAALTLCSGACVDTRSSSANCGGCGRSCPGGRVCSGGACNTTCAAGTTNCSGSCVDLTTSTPNCGACGRVCAAGQTCAGANCGCPAGTTLCGGGCVNTATDGGNCGACGRVCGGGSGCSAGSCVCASGRSLCGNVCLDTGSDPLNCGGCGIACGSGQICTAGQCGCGASVSLSAQVQPIFTASCANGGCHGGNRPSQGLSLIAGQSYGELVGVAASQCNDGRLLVKAGAPSSSYLMNKLTGTGLCGGSQMPKAGTSLPAAQLALIRGWICQGAPNN